MDPPFKSSQHAADLLGELVNEPMSSNPTNTMDSHKSLIRAPLLVNDVIMPVVKSEGEAEIITLEMRELPLAPEEIKLLTKSK